MTGPSNSGLTQAEIYAKHILENVMKRQRWSVNTRDAIAAELEAFASGEKRKTTSYRPRHQPQHSRVVEDA